MVKEDINSVHSGVRKSWDSVRIVDLNDHFQSGSPVTAVHNLNSQKSQTFSRKLMDFGEIHSGKANIGLISVIEIIAGLGYEDVCA